MTLYLWAAVGFGVLAVAAYPVLSYLIDKPEGTHRRAPWWQRIRERRLEERAQDAVNLRLLQDIHNGLRGEVARAATSRAPRTEWPLQPLPPGAEQHADHFHRWAAEPEPEAAQPPALDSELIRLGWTEEQWSHPDLWAPSIIGRPEWIGHREPEPEDPLDVATPEQVADELVGPLPRSTTGSLSTLLPGAEWISGLLPEPDPEPDPVVLTDYGPSTGSWEAVRDEVLDAVPLADAVMPKGGAG